jgi:protein O-mannosyl-transferase
MPADNSDKIFLRHAVSIGIILVATLLCFAFALDSLFLFDDYPNLDALIYIQGQSIFSSGFWEFVMGGNAGPTGRPVSLFTFALQAASWPDNPAAFKLVNLLIHSLNSMLVYGICFQITKALKLPETQAWKIVFFTTLIWAIHPIHTTVVLYAVQRMALLSNLFILLGIYLHMHIRLSGNLDKPKRQLTALSIALTLTGLLSLFSKENAPSLIFFLLILEYTVLKDISISRPFIRWRTIFLWLPALLTVILPLYFISHLQTDFASSYEYSLLNRLMTESRVLWQYLAIIFFPSTSGVGLFHDIEISLSLLSPISTLISVLFWLLILTLAFTHPGKQKILLMAILWYFAGHIIESSIFPLELFFNHRNYLAFLGLVFSLFYALFTLIPDKLLSAPLKVAFPFLYVFILFFQTVSISNLWRDPMKLSESWYFADSGTARNVEFYAITLANRDFDGMLQAAEIYKDAFALDSGDFRLLLNQMNLSCNSSFITWPDDALIIQSLEQVDRENRDLLTPIQQLVSLTTSNTCNIYSPELLYRIISHIMTVRPEQSPGLYEFELANLKFYTEDFDEGITQLQSSYEHSGDSGVLFSLSLRFINSGQYQQALTTIDQAINRLTIYNNIRTGTRDYKLNILYEMRSDVLGFIASEDDIVE